MAFSEGPSVVIEIQVQSIVDGQNAEYFMEWARPADFHRRKREQIKPGDACIRYLSPDWPFFTFLIKLKAGFQLGENFRGFKTEIIQLPAINKIAEREISKLILIYKTSKLLKMVTRSSECLGSKDVPLKRVHKHSNA